MISPKAFKTNLFSSRISAVCLFALFVEEFHRFSIYFTGGVKR
jgi:hypothetical protein